MRQHRATTAERQSFPSVVVERLRRIAAQGVDRSRHSFADVHLALVASLSPLDRANRSIFVDQPDNMPREVAQFIENDHLVFQPIFAR